MTGQPGAGAEGVFVSGTGTEVGKTVVAAVLARSLAATGRRVHVFKPAVSGLDELADSAGAPPADHELLRLAAGSGQSDAEIAPYRYGPPVSPHLGAVLAGEEIEPARLRAAARAAADGAEALICEGVGGLLVPLVCRFCTPIGDKGDTPPPPYLVRDLVADLGLPLVVAAAPGLGTINHTLLTVEAARAAGIEVVAVVLTPWPQEPSKVERSNRETIAALAGVEVQTLPHLPDLTDPATWPPLRVPMGRLRAA